MGVNYVNFANGEDLIDLRNDTVSEYTLYQGVTAHNSKGEQIIGRATPDGGGLSESDIFWITADMNLATMTVSNMSHSFAEVEAAVNSGKVVKLKNAFFLSSGQTRPFYAYADVVADLDSELNMQLMLQAPLGGKTQLFYFNVKYTVDNEVYVSPYIVNTTSYGG